MSKCEICNKRKGTEIIISHAGKEVAICNNCNYQLEFIVTTLKKVEAKTTNAYRNKNG
jgi:ribosome-binding protein aMBF1 (putative translation factor)